MCSSDIRFVLGWYLDIIRLKFKIPLCWLHVKCFSSCQQSSQSRVILEKAVKRKQHRTRFNSCRNDKTIGRITMDNFSAIHLLGDKVKLLEPACSLKESNSTPLNAALLIFSHNPRYSTVERLRNQFLTTSLGSSGLRTRAMSVNEM